MNDGWLKLTSTTAIFVIVYVPAVLYIVLNKYERKRLFTLIKFEVGK
jgi:hypothetical protein